MEFQKSPFDKDVLEGASDKNEVTSTQSELSEKDFIENKPFLNTLPFWIWPFFLAIATILAIGIHKWYFRVDENLLKDDPFMQVTNREFSVFLWEFPSYIRVNVSKKTGYLPAFYFDRENFDVTKGQDNVIAPPDLVFLYHTWKRQLSSQTPIRKIQPDVFNAFLAQLTEWDPKNWEEAPKEYKELVESKSYEKIQDMRTLTELELPVIVRQAFQGWKNYFQEGPEINQLQVTVEQVEEFLKSYPNYARPLWRNIDMITGQKVAGLNYLSFLLNQNVVKTTVIPNEQLSPFLKVAIFNSQRIN